MKFVKNLDVKRLKPFLIYDFNNYCKLKKQQELQDPRRGDM